MTSYTYSFPTDGLGWSSFSGSGTPHDGYSAVLSVDVTMIIHVAKNGHDDTGDGSAANPYLTISFAKGKLRNGSPDWLLLRKGDTWTDEIIHAGGTAINGKSATEPMLIGAYGTGARPKLEFNSTDQPFPIGSGDNGQFVALVGVELYCYERNPDDVRYVSGAKTNLPNPIDWSHGTTWNLIEDCKFSFFADLKLQTSVGASPNTKNNVFLRRNIITKNYGGQGIYCDGFGNGYNGTTNNSIVLYQNFIDKCTWADNWIGKGQVGTLFSHNVYANDSFNNAHTNNAASDTYMNGPIILDGNISSRDSVGSHLKGGGILSGNVWARNGSGFDFGRSIRGLNYSINGDLFVEQEDVAGDSTFDGQTVLIKGIDPDDYVTVTISIANPGVISFPYAHDLAVGDTFMFADNGDTLPSAYTKGTIYYVVSVPTTSTATLSATLDGSAISTSSQSQSGTHKAYWGASRGTVDVTNCVFANFLGAIDVDMNGYAIAIQSPVSHTVNVNNNIIHNWSYGAFSNAHSPIKNDCTYAGVIDTTGNAIYLSGTTWDNEASTVHAYLDSRSLNAYAAQIGVGSTYNDLFDYIGTNQSKDTWDSRLTAAAIITYFQAASTVSSTLIGQTAITHPAKRRGRK